MSRAIRDRSWVAASRRFSARTRRNSRRSRTCAHSRLPSTAATIANAPDQATREARIHARWNTDTARLRDRLNGLNNVGGYFPQYRALNESHCTTIVDFKNADVQAQNLELKHFIDSVLDGQGKVLDASEQDDKADKAKPFNLLYWLVDQLMG